MSLDSAARDSVLDVRCEASDVSRLEQAKALGDRIDALVRYHGVVLAFAEPFDAFYGGRCASAFTLVNATGMRVRLGSQELPMPLRRDTMVKEAARESFRRLVFLDVDVNLRPDGLERLMATMDRHGAALVSALCVRRDGKGLDAMVGAEGDLRMLQPKDVPASRTPFPAFAVGLSAALVDLERVGKLDGPRFTDRDGSSPFGDAYAFCRFLERHDLETVCDPGVRIGRMGPVEIVWDPEQR